jgi:hypothetical protein
VDLCIDNREMAALFLAILKMYGKPLATSPTAGWTLADVMQKDGLVVFSDSVPIEGRNRFLNDLLKSPKIKAEGWWTSPFGSDMYYKDMFNEKATYSLSAFLASHIKTP